MALVGMQPILRLPGGAMRRLPLADKPVLCLGREDVHGIEANLEAVSRIHCSLQVKQLEPPQVELMSLSKCNPTLVLRAMAGPVEMLNNGQSTLLSPGDTFYLSALQAANTCMKLEMGVPTEGDVSTGSGLPSSQALTTPPADAPLPPPVLLVLVGPPGAGKSTFSQALLAHAPSAWVVANQDTIANGKKGNRKQCIVAATQALQAGRSAIIDRCNIQVEQRADFLAIARDQGVPAHCVVLALPLKTCISRATARTSHPGGVSGSGAARIVSMAAHGMDAETPKADAEGLASLMHCTTDAQITVALTAWKKYSISASDPWQHYCANRPSQPVQRNIASFFTAGASGKAASAAASPRGHTSAPESQTAAPLSHTAGPPSQSASQGREADGEQQGSGAQGSVKRQRVSSQADQPSYHEMDLSHTHHAAGLQWQLVSSQGPGSGLEGTVGPGVRGQAVPKTPAGVKVQAASKANAGPSLEGTVSPGVQGQAAPKPPANAFQRLMQASKASDGGAKGLAASVKDSTGGAETKDTRFPSRHQQALHSMAMHPDRIDRQAHPEAQINAMCILINDMYPKAHQHVLLVAREPGLDSVSELSAAHLPLLVELRDMAMQWINNRRQQQSAESTVYRCGFHSLPSMRQLHLHILSQDLCGTGMKTKHHYQTFTTPFFLSLDEVEAALRTVGRVDVASAASHLKNPLQCHKCGKTCGLKGKGLNFPQMLEHLQTCAATYAGLDAIKA